MVENQRVSKEEEKSSIMQYNIIVLVNILRLDDLLVNMKCVWCIWHRS